MVVTVAARTHAVKFTKDGSCPCSHPGEGISL